MQQQVHTTYKAQKQIQNEMAQMMQMVNQLFIQAKDTERKNQTRAQDQIDAIDARIL